MIPYTTLKKLREADACIDRYRHLKQCLGKTFKQDTPISLVTILNHNGLNDVLWIPEDIVMGDDIQKRYRLFAVACCQDVLHLMTDVRSRDVVRVAHLFAYGEATKNELAVAADATQVAARATADAARDATQVAAWAAAQVAARATADAAGDAAWAAWAAAWAAADAASAAASAAADAASAAADAAARAAAGGAAARDAAWAAAWAAAGGAAGGAAAWAAAWGKQAEHFKIIFSADFNDDD